MTKHSSNLIGSGYSTTNYQINPSFFQRRSTQHSRDH